MDIKRVLAARGITQIELAEKLGINRVSVSRLLSDANDMRESTMTKIADAIGVPVWQFFLAPDELPNQNSSDFLAMVKDGDAMYCVRSKEEFKALAKKIIG